MTRRAWLRAAGIGLPLALVGACTEGGDAASGGLSVSAVRFPGGREWNGTEPLRAEVVLLNRSTQETQIWDPANSEGSRCVTLLLKDAAGHTFPLAPPGVERSGMPTAWRIAAGKEAVLPMEFRYEGGGQGVPNGDYQVDAAYENRLPAAGPVRGVWTGRVVTTTAPGTLVVKRVP